MTVESIHIEEFGKLSDFSLSFDGALNIIEGANESGKSTIAAFVRFMLYGFPPASDTGLSERKKRLSWKGGTAAGRMDITAGNRRYRIARSVSTGENGSPQESCTVTDLETGLPAFAHAVPGDAILGIPDNVFASTAFVSQITDAKVGGTQIADAIENLIFSGDEKVNTARALEQLAEAKSSLLHEGGHGGVLYNLGQKKEELERRLAVAEAEHRELLEKEAELARYTARYADYRSQVEKLKKIEIDYKNASTIRAFDFLHELEQKAEALREKIEALDTENRHGEHLPAEEDRERLAHLIESISERKTALTETEDAATLAASRAVVTDEDAMLISRMKTEGGEADVRLKVRAAAQKKTVFLSLLISFPTLAALLFLIGTLLLELPFLPPNNVAWFFIILCGGLLIGGIVMIPLFILARRNFSTTIGEYGAETMSDFDQRLAYLKKEEERIITLSAEASEAKKTAERAKEKYKEVLAEASRVLAQSGDDVPSDDTIHALTARADETIAYLSRREELLKEKSKIDAKIRELRLKLGDTNEVQIRATVPPNEREHLATIDHPMLVKAIEDNRRKANQSDDHARETERQILVRRAKVEDPLLLAAELGETLEKMEQYMQQHGAYAVAEHALRHAGERLRTEITPRLAGYAARFMEIATHGKYKAISVSKNIELAFTQDENEHSAEYMSAGTQDIAYLSLRMALIDLLCDEMPPLFFDESFAHQDDTRADGLIAAVRALTDEGKQIFLFTCHTRESQMAKSHFEHFKHIRFGIAEEGRPSSTADTEQR